jgi:hypothetical protein
MMLDLQSKFLKVKPYVQYFAMISENEPLGLVITNKQWVGGLQSRADAADDAVARVELLGKENEGMRENIGRLE